MNFKNRFESEKLFYFIVALFVVSIYIISLIFLDIPDVNEIEKSKMGALEKLLDENLLIILIVCLISYLSSGVVFFKTKIKSNKVKYLYKYFFNLSTVYMACCYVIIVKKIWFSVSLDSFHEISIILILISIISLIDKEKGIKGKESKASE